MTRARVLLLVGSLVVGAIGCGKPRDAVRDDPNRPAVVQAPPVVLPSDTAKPDTMMNHRERMSQLSRELLEPYATISAGIVFRDRRLLTGVYAPLAELTLDDSLYKGTTNIADALIAMGQRSGLTDWQRHSRVLSSHVDSIYVDSGYYAMRAARPGGVKREETGSYVSTWRHLGGPTPWVLLKDQIKAAAPAKKR